MPTWLIIVLIVLLVLVVGGMIARAMVNRRNETEFHRRVQQADHDLAQAAAADRGWDRSVLEGAARSIYAAERGAEPSELLLVEVLDRPGTDDDVAIFRADGGGRHETLTLGRHDGEWRLESLE